MILEQNNIKENCLNIIKKEWQFAKATSPDFLTVINKEKKIENEESITIFSNNFKEQLNHFTRNPFMKKKWRKNTLGMFHDFLNSESILFIRHSMKQESFLSFQEELKDFLRHVRQFAPELSMEGIGQAIRNYIVYAMFNELNELQPHFNMAAFGYSMLYPFTDNYIDSEHYSLTEKNFYNQLIRNTIEGKKVHPNSTHQKKTCELLKAIELHYPRDSHSSIYMLLLMMLDAQEYSIIQQSKEHQLSYEERLYISIYKGGTSVLIDRFFVKRELSQEDLIFYFGFGFFLQLADDLQDIKEDIEQGNQTIFTLDLHNKKLEHVVNKMFQFIHRITNSYQTKNEVFKDFILNNCYQLIFSSVLKSNEFFTKEYLHNLEPYFPITFSFLESMKHVPVMDKDTKKQIPYMKLLDELIKD